MQSSGHRFVYIKQNKNDLKPHEVMTVPFLHEKRVYLNRLKKNTEYFYTSIKTDSALDKSKDQSNIICMNVTDSKFYTYGENGLLK